MIKDNQNDTSSLKKSEPIAKTMNTMVNRCVATACSNTARASENWKDSVVLYKYPGRNKEQERFGAWVYPPPQS